MARCHGRRHSHHWDKMSFKDRISKTLQQHQIHMTTHSSAEHEAHLIFFSFLFIVLFEKEKGKGCLLLWDILVPALLSYFNWHQIKQFLSKSKDFSRLTFAGSFVFRFLFKEWLWKKAEGKNFFSFLFTWSFLFKKLGFINSTWREKLLL